jgi:hypothetical protein
MWSGGRSCRRAGLAQQRTSPRSCSIRNMLTDPRQSIASLVVPLCFLVLPSDAVAQTGILKRLSMDRQPAASARVSPPVVELERLSRSVEDSTGRAQLAQRGRSRDSLKNGTIIGAVVGAVALGAFAAVVCNAEQEPEGPSCLPDTLRVAAVGAAIGAGTGLVVDAALSRHAGVTMSFAVRF